MKRLQVKVCGITRIRDARLAITHGADMLGFIFYKKSPRFVSQKNVKAILENIDPTVGRVGVFVNEDVNRVLRISNKLQLDFVQLSGNEKQADINKVRKAGFKVIKTVHLGTDNRKYRAKLPRVDIVQFDTADREKYGGTGKQFDWNIKLPKVRNLMLSGGIDSENVLSGIKKFNPVIVDVNSGVESKPGIKSSQKLTAFMRICNNYRYGE